MSLAPMPNVGIGLYPTSGLTLSGDLRETARIEVAGSYDSANGVTLGTRAVCHRIYDSWFGGVVMGDNCFAEGSDALNSFNSGHVVIWSTSKGKSYPTTGTSFYANVAAGAYDAHIRNMFNRIESLDWGGAVQVIPTSTGLKLPIPGSTYGGTKPTELWYVFCHEPNINTGGNVGTSVQFGEAFLHIMQLYDSMGFAGGGHVKFAVCMSASKATAADTWWNRGGGANCDLTKTGVRPCDGAGWDLYYPSPEVGSNSPLTASSAESHPFAGSDKFGGAYQWTLAHMPLNTPNIIPEFAVRMPTSPVNGGTGPAPTWPATWWTAALSWMNSNRLANGDSPVRYMCQYVAQSVLNNSTTGGADNAILPDMTTHSAAYQLAGVSLRPSWTAYHDALVQAGNPSLASGQPGTVPTGLTAPAPAAGVNTTTLSWTGGPTDVSYNIYKDGVLTQSGITSLSTAIYATGGQPYPQSHDWQVSALGTDGHETALSTAVTVNFTPVAGTVPGTPTGLAVSNIGQSTATATVNAPSGQVDGYNWFVDGGSQPWATSTDPTVTLTGLSSGANHSVTCLAYNAAGPSPQTAAVPFQTNSSLDNTAPTVPGAPTLQSAATAHQVQIQWPGSTDPVVSGSVTSGVQSYAVMRSFQELPGSGVEIGMTDALTLNFTDSTPPSSALNPTSVFYFVAAIDAAGNMSDWSPALPVTIPVAPLGLAPTVVLTLPQSLQVGQDFTVDASNSYPGTGGSIKNYKYDFGDGTVVTTTLPQATHQYADFREYNVTVTVTDVNGNSGHMTSQLIAAPPTGLYMPYTGSQLIVPGSPIAAADVDTILLAHESALQNLSDQLTQAQAALTAIGTPPTPRRMNNAIFYNLNPAECNATTPLAAATGYVFRMCSPLGQPVTEAHLVQHATGVTGITNAFLAVFDVTGTLVSPTTATDISSKLEIHGEVPITLDGGPYSFPIGADDTDPSVSNPTNEFFLLLWLATIGGTAPQIACGSTFANALDLGATTPITPSQANIQSVPQWGLSSNGPSAALTPPTQLGQILQGQNAIAVVLF